MDENMQDRVFEGRIGGMSMCFPTPIHQVELDRTAECTAAVDSNNGI